jgi:hypothetical protein
MQDSKEGVGGGRGERTSSESLALGVPYAAACTLAISLASSRPLKPSVLEAACATSLACTCQTAMLTVGLV